MNLFEFPENWPANLQAILTRYEGQDQTYANLIQLEEDLLKIGYSIQYGLDCIPYNLKKMYTEKINLDTELNLNKLKARVLTMLRKLPDLYDNDYEPIVRQIVRDNFMAEKIERFEDHFILFSIGRPSVFDQIITN